MRGLVIILLAASAAHGQYDLLLKSGHVIDGKNGVSAVRDVAIQNGRIAAVEADIPASQALKSVDVSGLYVTPGLVDIHVHVYAGAGHAGGYNGDNSVYPDGFTFRTVVSLPAESWAVKVFPQLTPAEAVTRLGQEIARTVRLDQPDPTAAWRQHTRELISRAAYLTARRYAALHFRRKRTLEQPLGQNGGGLRTSFVGQIAHRARRRFMLHHNIPTSMPAVIDGSKFP